MNPRLYVIAAMFGLTAMVLYYAASAYAQIDRGAVTGAGAQTAERPQNATPLTRTECEDLDGEVIVNTSCTVTGLACSTESPSGRLRLRCIDEVEPTLPPPPPPPEESQAQAGGNGPMAGVRGPEATVAVPLTPAECRGLGGEVEFDFFNRCPGAMLICRRQNRRGYWVSVCIREPD